MQQMTPSRIFRKSEAAYDIAKVSGIIIAFGIIISIVLSFTSN